MLSVEPVKSTLCAAVVPLSVTVPVPLVARIFAAGQERAAAVVQATVEDGHLAAPLTIHPLGRVRPKVSVPPTPARFRTTHIPWALSFATRMESVGSAMDVHPK